MALTRKMLKAMGIEDDKVDEIISAHTEVTDALKEQVQKLTTKTEKFDAVEKELNSLKEKGGDWQEKFENEHKAFEEYKTSIENEKALKAKQTAYKGILKEAGISDKYFDSILGVTRFDELSFNKDGSITNKEKVIDEVKDKYSDFVINTVKKGANPANPPENTGGSTLSKKSIMEIKDATERQQKIAENIQLFQK